MTREEAIEILRKHNEWRRYNGPIGEGPEPTNPTELGVAIDTIVNVPKIDGVEEAAYGYAWDKEQPLTDEERLSYHFNPRIDGFKAGAEWMGEQGETFESEISNTSILSLPKLNLQAGDKVIVQIRKK